MALTTARSPVAGRVISCGALDDVSRSAMCALLAKHFDGVTRAAFDRDLAEKDFALLLERDGELVGFSTFAAYATRHAGRSVNVICSGDTIVDPSAWSSAALPREWISAVKSIERIMPPGPLYWLLITSGFRTYRLLPTFWIEFWPRASVSTPPEMQLLLQTLAAERYGPQFDSASGVVRLNGPQTLRAHLSDVQPERLKDQDVAFFLAANPGHRRGDELVCLCELSETNMTAAGRRMMFGARRG